MARGGCTLFARSLCSALLALDLGGLAGAWLAGASADASRIRANGLAFWLPPNGQASVSCADASNPYARGTPPVLEAANTYGPGVVLLRCGAPASTNDLFRVPRR